MKTLTMYILSSIAVLCCIAQGNDTFMNYESKYNTLIVSYPDTWELLPGYDTRKKTLFGIIDKRDGKSIIIKIRPDISQKKLSNEKYYEAIKTQMLSANVENKLIEEKDTIYKGEIYHLQSYLMNTKPWGLLKQVSFVKRDGKKVISIQISFPIQDESEKDIDFPSEIVEQNKRIKLKKNNWLQ